MKNTFYSICLIFIAALISFTSCKKENLVPESFSADSLISGTWRVSSFRDSEEDRTAEFAGYLFSFKAGGAMTASNSRTLTNGVWNIDDSSNEIHLEIGNSSPLSDISKGWIILESTSTTLKLSDNSSGGGGLDFVRASSLADAKLLQAPHTAYPNITDPNINIFATSQHYAYAPSTPRNQLLIFLPGTGAQPSGCERWMLTAQEQGFHVIGLYYPNTGLAPQYDTMSGQQWINQYAYEIIFGVNRSSITSVNYANSIQNRLIKYLQWLKANYPTENWGQYLTGDSLLWTKCTFSAHSLGGNFAAAIGKFRQVQRVICMSSPRVAPQTDWGTFKTPLSRYYFFWHDLDKASDFRDQYTILREMGISAPVVITDQTNSSSWGHVLKTVYACSPSTAHKIVVSDTFTPLISDVPYYKPVWIHLMTK